VHNFDISIYNKINGVISAYQRTGKGRSIQTGAIMPIRKLIDDRIIHLDAQIEAHMDEKARLIEQMDAFNVAAFAYGAPTSEHDYAAIRTAPEHGTPELMSGAFKASHKARKATRKTRVESGPRRTGLKAEVLEHIMRCEGGATFKGIAFALNAKLQSVRIAMEGLLKAEKIGRDSDGNYHRMENVMEEAESNMETAA
jgi:hypothetical protein